MIFKYVFPDQVEDSNLLHVCLSAVGSSFSSSACSVLDVFCVAAVNPVCETSLRWLQTYSRGVEVSDDNLSLDCVWETIMSCTSSTLKNLIDLAVIQTVKADALRSCSPSIQPVFKNHNGGWNQTPASFQVSSCVSSTNQWCGENRSLRFLKKNVSVARRLIDKPPPTSVTPLPAAVSRVISLHTTVHLVHTTHGPNRSLGGPQSTTPMFGIWQLSPEATSAPRGSSTSDIECCSSQGGIIRFCSLADIFSSSAGALPPSCASHSSYHTCVHQEISLVLVVCSSEQQTWHLCQFHFSSTRDKLRSKTDF